MRIYFEQIPEDGKKFNITKAFNVDETGYFVEKFEGLVYPVGKGYFLDAKISLVIEDNCDRCLEKFKENFEERISLEIVKNSKEDEDNVELTDEDVGLYIVDENLIDLEQILMQESILLRPVKRICSDDCHGICSTCGANLNIEKCSCKTDIDDRWKALAELMQKNNKII